MSKFLPDPRLMEIRVAIEDLAKEINQDPCDLACMLMETFMGEESINLGEDLLEAIERAIG